MVRRLLLALALLAAGVAAAAAPALARPTYLVHAPRKLARAIPQVKRHTRSAILIPDVVPVTGVRPSRVFGSQATFQGSWELDLGVGRRCQGANFCSLGDFQAMRGRKLDKGRYVRLYGGTTGHYLGIQCGANCAPPAITFRHNAYVYYFFWSARFRGQSSFQTLVNLANQALRHGPR